ncbi:MAG: hypothetical protein AABW81_00650 [Nanoarchaeota archaeon]|mgnify:CR=1 FL=1
MKTKLALNIAVSALLASILSSFISAQTGDYTCGFGGMGGMMSGTYGYGFMWFGWIFSLLVFVALVLLIMWLIKQIQKK